jgi:hypothetical protein
MPRTSRFVLPGLAALGVGLACSTQSASAQERLVGSRTSGVGVSYEHVNFGGAGLLQSAFAGIDTARVKSVDQFTLPITASTPLGAGSWRLDVTTLYASGQVTFSDRLVPGGTRTAKLSGISDVRTRATGRFLHDAVVMTVGLNLPTGQTTLDGSEFSTLRIVASPALGLGSSPVGSGLSGTVGLVFAQQVGPWSLAYGSSYEARGKYQPVAALIAGTGASDFLPGGVLRLSLGADRLVGTHRLSIAAAADVFADDRLRGAAIEDSATITTLSESRVRLGPVLSGDVQLLIAAPRFRELLAYSSFRWRAPYSRDGKTVERSSGQYLDAGTRAVLPWGPQRGVILSADARWHSGLGVDQGLPTAGVTSGALSAGLQIERGLLSFYPYVRAQGGSLRQRSAQVESGSQSFLGAGGGLVIVSRF